jgi:hypothetical protein
MAPAGVYAYTKLENHNNTQAQPADMHTKQENDSNTQAQARLYALKQDKQQ